MAYQAKGPHSKGPVWMSVGLTTNTEGVGYALLFGIAALIGLFYLAVGPLSVIAAVKMLVLQAQYWVPDAGWTLAAAAAKGAAVGIGVSLLRRWNVRRSARRSLRDRIVYPSILAAAVAGMAIGIAAATLGVFTPTAHQTAGPSPVQQLLLQSDWMAGGGGPPPDAGASSWVGVMLAVLLALVFVGLTIGALCGAGVGTVGMGALTSAVESAAQAASEARYRARISNKPSALERPLRRPLRSAPAHRATIWESARDAARSGWMSGLVATVIGFHVNTALASMTPDAQSRMLLFDIMTLVGTVLVIATLRTFLGNGRARIEMCKAARDVGVGLLILLLAGAAIALVSVLLKR